MPSFKNLSPPALQSNLQFFFHMLEASFVILIKLPLFSPSFPPPFLFIALPWARHSICGGIQSKKKDGTARRNRHIYYYSWRLQHTSFSNWQEKKRKEKKTLKGFQSCGELQIHTVRYGTGDKWTNKQILSVLWVEDDQEGLGRVFQSDCKLHKGSELLASDTEVKYWVMMSG